jgi:hypothetical protein
MADAHARHHQRIHADPDVVPQHSVADSRQGYSGSGSAISKAPP